MSGKKETVNLINFGNKTPAEVKELEDAFAANLPPGLKKFASTLLYGTVSRDFATNMAGICESLSRNRLDSNRKKKVPQPKKAVVVEPKVSGKAQEEEKVSSKKKAAKPKTAVVLEPEDIIEPEPSGKAQEEAEEERAVVTVDENDLRLISPVEFE